VFLVGGTACLRRFTNKRRENDATLE